MKTIYYGLIAALLIFVSCKDDTEKIFEKSADERAVEARQELKDKLTSSENGWRLKYRPEDESGSYWVLLNFSEDNKLVIQSDLGVRGGEFFMDTLTYRIDNSLGLELVFETYSFFSYLFERNQATFLAEYEFIYANETPDGSLVFQSKSDPQDSKTNLLFERAGADDADLLGTNMSGNLNELANDINGLIFSAPSYELSYLNKDLSFFLSLDVVARTIGISSATKKSTGASQEISFFTGYYLQGDSLILDEAFSGTYMGYNISFKSILFSRLSSSTLDLCGGRDVSTYEGVTSQDDFIQMQATLNSPEGATFADSYSFYYGPVQYILSNGESTAEQLNADLPGVNSIQLYLGNSGIYALGFMLENADGTSTWALWEFTPVIEGNRIRFNFEPTYSVFGNTDSPANLDNIIPYIEAFTQGGETYLFKIQDGIYEMNNPCSGWTAALFGQ